MITRKCNHCKMTVDSSARVCPYCGEDPWSPMTRVQKQKQALEYEERKQKRAAKIQKYGYWGYLWRTLVKGIVIIVVFFVRVLIVGIVSSK